MTTAADVIAECRNDYLMSGAREARNLLAADVNASATTFTFTYDLGGIDVGAKLSVGLEDLYVWDVTATSKTATVSRGDFGSTAATHTTGATVLVNSLFTDAQILRAINNELDALSADGLFHMRSVDLTYNAAVSGYDLTSVTDVIDVYGIRYAANGSDVDYPWVDTNLWEHARSLDTSVFPSGQAIFMRGNVDPGRTMRVLYKAPFSPLAALTDNVTTVSGLHNEARDLLALGAAIRLTAGREVRRNFNETQGDTRRANEVPAGANLGANRGLMQQRQVRLGEERRRLNRQYPVRIR